LRPEVEGWAVPGATFSGAVEGVVSRGTPERSARALGRQDFMVVESSWQTIS
jgi:hypothetical protein